MKLILLYILLLLYSPLRSQVIYYQDVFHGGVTGDGFSCTLGAGIGALNLHISPGSTINSAYLVFGIQGDPQPIDIILNNLNIHINLSDRKTLMFSSPAYAGNASVGVIDLKSIINPNITNYSLTIPPQIDWNNRFTEFYIIVGYKNISLNVVNQVIILNQQDFAPTIKYDIKGINPIINLFPTGFIVSTGYFCDTISDGSYIKLNGNQIGLMGGNDYNSLGICAGVMGSFYYENKNLYSLGDDSINISMNGSDGLSNISSLLISSSDSIHIQFNHQTPTFPLGYTNSVWANFLTYTTPCAIIPVVVSSDTSICQGQALQLTASGGTKYEWKCLTDTLPYGNSVYGLSCKNCANPIFSGNSSAIYTVRVWSGDSCSVVRPVRVTVNSRPKGVFSTIQTTCGEQKGIIKMQSNPALQTFYAIAENGDTLQSSYQSISQVSAGNYTAFYIDTNGCKSNDSLVTVKSFSNVTADFTITPTSGGAPLGVHINNTSQNAQNYQWSINGQNVGNPPTHFDTSGTYQIQLVAWNQYPECSDTMTKTVLVFDSLIVQIPNVFSPNNDGVNDIFTIQTNLPVHIKAIILNRWGNEVFACDKSLTVGNNDVWNGMSNNSAVVTDGTYFYRITFQLDDKVVDCNLQPCEVKKEGFVQVVR